MSRIHRRLAARLDLANHGEYIGQRNPRAAERFLDAVERALRLLADMPTLGSLNESPHPAYQDIRFWSVRKFENYVIAYRPTDDGIELLRVFQGAQDIEANLGNIPE